MMEFKTVLLCLKLLKGKSAILPLFIGPEVLSSACDKAKLFTKNFSKNSNLDNSGISLTIFPSRTNLKVHNISITPLIHQRCLVLIIFQWWF